MGLKDRQTNRQTNKQTYKLGNSMTESAQWGSVSENEYCDRWSDDINLFPLQLLFLFNQNMCKYYDTVA